MYRGDPKLIPHPIFRAAFKQYTQEAVLKKLGLWQKKRSPRTLRLLHDPKNYLTLNQLEDLAGISNLTFYQVVEIIRGQNISKHSISNWFEGA